jgi:hypothetical protein
MLQKYLSQLQSLGPLDACMRFTRAQPSMQQPRRTQVRRKMERTGSASLTRASTVLTFNKYTKSFIKSKNVSMYRKS